MTKEFGVLAEQFSGIQLPLRVMRSNAGAYIGTEHPEDGSPFSRESEEYFAAPEEALHALVTGNWTQREHP